MIHKIEIGEHCFGSYVRIDDKSLLDESYDDCKLNADLSKFIINQLILVKNKLTDEHISTIMSIIMGNTQNLNFKLTEEEYESLSDDDGDYLFLCKKFNYNRDTIIGELISIHDNLLSISYWYEIMKIILEIHNSKTIKYSQDSCDQCGNWNYDETYNLEL